jgi:hypothetical protein
MKDVRGPVLALWATVVAVLLSGCSTAVDLRDDLAPVRSALIEAGFDDAGVHVGRVEGTKLSEDLATMILVGGDLDAEEATEVAARVVWDELPMRFDTLVMEYDGQRYEVGYAELEARFGPRADGLDDVVIRDVIGAGLQAAAWLAAGILLVALLPVGLIVWRRRSRSWRRGANNELDTIEGGARTRET